MSLETSPKLNLLSDLVLQIAERLKANLPTALAAAVVPEDAKDVFSDIEKRKAKGLLICISTPSMTRFEGVEGGKAGVVHPLIEIKEHTVLNRSPEGSGVYAPDIGVAVAGQLVGWQPREHWSPLEFEGLELTDADGVNRLVTYELTLQTTTLLMAAET